MKIIRRQALLPFSAKQMFDLVDDIEKYPEFLPGCNNAKVLERTEDTVTATLSVAKGGFAKEFTTRNTNQPYENIAMELVMGPFKHLTGQWKFDALGESACKIELVVKFEFSNPLTNLAFGAVFNQMAESFVDAFSKRARQVYAS